MSPGIKHCVLCLLENLNLAVIWCWESPSWLYIWHFYLILRVLQVWAAVRTSLHLTPCMLFTVICSLLYFVFFFCLLKGSSSFIGTSVIWMLLTWLIAVTWMDCCPTAKYDLWSLTLGLPQGRRSLWRWATPRARELLNTCSSCQLITWCVRYS